MSRYVRYVQEGLASDSDGAGLRENPRRAALPNPGVACDEKKRAPIRIAQLASECLLQMRESSCVRGNNRTTLLNAAHLKEHMYQCI